MATRNCSSSLTKHARLVSGGGEWGAKAGLLSLDPQIEYDGPSEAESLESFQSSFQGDVKAAGGIANPGDVIQFFVEPASEDTKDHGASSSEGVVPFMAKFGVSDVIQEPELQEKQLLQHHTSPGPLVSEAFGGYSSEGIYMSVPYSKSKTKIDVPGSCIQLRCAKIGHINHRFKPPVEERVFVGPRRVLTECTAWRSLNSEW